METPSTGMVQSGVETNGGSPGYIGVLEVRGCVRSMMQLDMAVSCGVFWHALGAMYRRRDDHGNGARGDANNVDIVDK